ncbi:MAG: hypothetical protein ACJAVM_002119 [Sulfitobacter sp.]|jgi:hypothetical protein
MTQTATYDLTAIMQDAWARVRKSNVAKFGLRFILRNALRAAWSEAKHQWAMARLEAQAASESPEVRRIKTAITEIEGKNRWSQQDYARRGVLRAALRAAGERQTSTA